MNEWRMKASNQSMKPTAQPTLADIYFFTEIFRHDFAPELRLTARSVFRQTASNGGKNRLPVGV
jgi:hypothetical protein